MKTAHRAKSLTLLICLLLLPMPAVAQTAPSSLPSLTASVDEVEIIFHAADARNMPILDLKPDEVNVFDDEHGPGRIVSMQPLEDRPIRAAFLLDTSSSVNLTLSRSRSTAQAALHRLLVDPQDEGAVVAFGRSRRVLESWTHRTDRLDEGVAGVGIGLRDPIDGTSLYDTLFSTCLYDFADSKKRNVILLFSDGVDTASYTTMQAAIERCRQSRTAIYAFGPRPVAAASPLGLATLLQLTQRTGGRFFYIEDRDALPSDLEIIEADLSNQYRLLYRPKSLVHDGAFHTIVLTGSERVAQLAGTSGFYAPTH